MAVYKPTNKGWGNAATVAKAKSPTPIPKAAYGLGFTQQPGGILTDPGVWKADQPGYSGNPGDVPSMEGVYGNDWKQGIPQYDVAPIDAGGGPGGGGNYWGAALGALEGQRDEALGAAKIGVGNRIKQALIDLGLEDVSTLDESIRGYIDEPTLAAAKANKYSVFAQTAEAGRKATAKSRAQLAARGMLSSGQLTKDATDITAEGEKSRYAGVRDFTGAAQGGIESLAQAQRDWASRIAQARMEAAAAGWGGGSGGGGGGGDNGQYLGGNTGDQGAGLYGRAGEYAGGATVVEGYNPNRNSDARYDMSGAQKVDGGYYLNGVYFDESGRVR